MICILYAYIGCIAVSCSVDVLVQDTLVGFYSLVVIEYIHWVLSRLFNFISSIWLVQSLSLSLLPPGTHLRASVSCQEAWDCHGWCWKSQSRKVSRRHGEFKPQITSTCHGVLDCRVWKYVEVSIFSHRFNMSIHVMLFLYILRPIAKHNASPKPSPVPSYEIISHLWPSFMQEKKHVGEKRKPHKSDKNSQTTSRIAPPTNPSVSRNKKKRLIYIVFGDSAPGKCNPPLVKKRL